MCVSAVVRASDSKQEKSLEDAGSAASSSASSGAAAAASAASKPKAAAPKPKAKAKGDEKLDFSNKNPVPTKKGIKRKAENSDDEGEDITGVKLDDGYNSAEDDDYKVLPLRHHRTSSHQLTSPLSLLPFLCPSLTPSRDPSMQPGEAAAGDDDE